VRHCLDAWVVLEFLSGGEPARTRLVELLESERPLMSWIDVGEVAYVVERRRGAEEAARVVAQLRAGLTLDAATPARVLEAASIKARHAVGYADAFAVATALAHGAVLVTGDPEILAANRLSPVEDVRSQGHRPGA
jgi:predicted nucleic acid-binding protein